MVLNYCYNLEMLKISKNKKKIFINLRGGLGNQLFCYFAGEYLRQRLEVTIVYVYHSKSNVHHRFNSKINSFNLKSNQINSTGIKFKIIVTFMFLKRFIFANKNKQKFVKNQNTLINFIFPEIYEEKYFKFEEETAAIAKWIKTAQSKNLYLRGFFQEFKYFDSCTFNKLELKKTSVWFKKITKEMNNKSPIVIHVRLGDYLNTGLGVLSVEYYKAALVLAEKRFPNNEIWVFSDEIWKAKLILEPIINNKFRFITNADGQNPAEILLAMSYGNLVIISNSTFSLWSARLASDSIQIIYPDIFFKDRAFSLSNFSEKWTSVKAHWLCEDEVSHLLQ